MHSGSESATRRLLLVEDSPDVLIVLKELLSHPRVEIHVATNGVEAVARAREVIPHAIVLDVRMPGMDGFEVFRILRREQSLRYARVIFVSAQADSGAMDLAKDLGAFAWMRKPFDEVRLQSRVLQALELPDPHAGRRPFAPRKTPPPRSATPVPPGHKRKGPEILLLVAPEASVVGWKRRFEECADVRVIPAVDAESVVRLGRSPLVRAIIVEMPPDGMTFGAFLQHLAAQRVEAPVVQLTSGAPGHPSVITLIPGFLPLNVSRLLSSIESAPRRSAGSDAQTMDITAASS